MCGRVVEEHAVVGKGIGKIQLGERHGAADLVKTAVEGLVAAFDRERVYRVVGIDRYRKGKADRNGGILTGKAQGAVGFGTDF